jgi:gas vesicle protein
MKRGCDSTSSWTGSFLLGGLVGAAVTMLVVSESGKEMRQQIKHLAKDLKYSVGDYYEDVKDSVISALKHGKGSIEERKERITEAVLQAHRESHERMEELIRREKGVAVTQSQKE